MNSKTPVAACIAIFTAIAAFAMQPEGSPAQPNNPPHSVLLEENRLYAARLPVARVSYRPAFFLGQTRVSATVRFRLDQHHSTPLSLDAALDGVSLTPGIGRHEQFDVTQTHIVARCDLGRIALESVQYLRQRAGQAPQLLARSLDRDPAALGDQGELQFAPPEGTVFAKAMARGCEAGKARKQAYRDMRELRARTWRSTISPGSMTNCGKVIDLRLPVAGLQQPGTSEPWFVPVDRLFEAGPANPCRRTPEGSYVSPNEDLYPGEGF